MDVGPCLLWIAAAVFLLALQLFQLEVVVLLDCFLQEIDVGEEDWEEDWYYWNRAGPVVLRF